MNQLADMAQQVSDEEQAQKRTTPDRFHRSAKQQIAGSPKSAFHPYRREEPRTVQVPLQPAISAEAIALQKSILGLWKAILTIPNLADLQQTMGTLLETEKSKPIQARRIVLSAMVGNAADVTARLNHPDFNLGTKEKDAVLQTVLALHQAVLLGHLDVVKAIVSHPKVTPAVVNCPVLQNKVSQSVLLMALDCGQDEIARYLLSYPKTNVNQTFTSLPMTALYKAQFKRPALVQDILNHPQLDLSVPAQLPQGANALLAAAYLKQSEIFEQLLNHPKMSKPIVNWANPKGENILFKTLFYDRPEMAQKLREHPKFDLNHRFPSGETALIRAAEAGNLQAVQQYLQEPQLDLTFEDQEIKALFEAGANGHSTIYDLIKNVTGLWPLQIMSKHPTA